MSRNSPTLRRAGVALVLAAAAVGTAAPAHAASRTLNIYGQAQQQSNWCWAATGNTIAGWFGASVSQNTFCDLAFGYSTAYTCPNNQATLGNDQTAFRALGINPGYYVSYAVNYTTISTDIAAGRPLNTRIQWSSGGGHMMAIYGYDSAYSQISWYNPWPSDSRYNYGSYSYYRSNGSFTWTHSLYGIGA
ncbi:papain-like cysteine protease family protein [Luteipulveratus sp. YIM 133132]|uniref:papain-like cysteine protease family protein n=1 Tax=Luteipulveratus flavus TaxID=3031728 RepID=UPI0023AE78FA|nr:papain-like cysteine protease family protein [Luteipulveratus sp. YIM 133132]MDE9364344.1 papain-like cysteine protease family protein [Luteipulveratus sp. YIM 133132]